MGFYQKMADDRKAGKMGPEPKYRVLQVDMLKQADREKAASLISFVQSGDDAYKLAGHDGFAYRDLDLRRRCGVILYKGVEVALLFKREIIEREPGPADPVPERTIKDPSGAWLQIDLLTADPVEKRKGIGDRLSSALAQVSRLQMLWQGEEGRRRKAEEDLDKVQKDRELLKALRERVGLYELSTKALTKEIEGLRKEVREQKELRRADKLELVRQMFPTFNTVWLAGVHRVGDQLYGIIKKQLTEALGQIGVKFVEPPVGTVFDPNKHHAVHTTPFPTGAKEVGAVVQVHRVGWEMGGIVIEAADVVVGIEQEEKNGDNGKKTNGGAGVQSDSGLPVSEQ